MTRFPDPTLPPTTLPDTTPTSPPPPVPLPPVPLPVPDSTGTTTVAVNVPAPGPDLQAQIARLRRDLDDARSQANRFQERLRTAQDAHRADIAAIGEALITEADERGWCTEYDEFIERLNDSLNVDLPARLRTWQVIVPLRVTVRVEARTDDEAVDRAREIADDLESCLRRNDQVVTADTDSYHSFEASQADD